ncbi:MAG: helix-turn-helix domain-containing protein [Prevotella sp.]|nr:helix-turn-helix domain-containing protein [Prevotella sp.]
MKNSSPKRLSFSELKTLTKDLKQKGNVPPFINKDIGMLDASNTSLAQILKVGTPYIIEDCRLGLVKRGNGVLTVNMIEHSVKKNTLAFIGAGCIVQPKEFSPDLEVCGMMVSNDRLNMALNGNVPAAIGTNATCLIVEVSQEEADYAEGIFQLIWELVHQDNYPEGTLNGLIHALIHYYIGMNKRNENDLGDGKPRNRMIFDKFIQLLNIHCKKEHSIGFYADKMCVTPRYLGVAVKNTSGVTAKEWIDRAVVTTAKVMLRHSNKQVTQISDELDFPNPSFFCKFFKRMTSMTPQEYREN